MKYTINDVTKKLGLTRRALQEYDRLHICSPSDRGTLWQYSEERFRILSVLALLKMAGMTRTEMKHLIDKAQSKKDFIRILDTAQERLSQKKQKIDTALMLIPGLKRQVESEVFSEIISDPGHDDSFRTEIELSDVLERIVKEPDIVNAIADIPKRDDVKFGIFIAGYLSRIAMYRYYAAEAVKVQEIVEEYCKYVLIEHLKVMAGETGFKKVLARNSDVVDIMASSVGYFMARSFFESEKNTTMIKTVYGDAAPEFVMAALKYYYNKFPHDEKEEEDMYKNG